MLKQMMNNRPHVPFLMMGLVAGCIALISTVFYPESYFDINVRETTLNIYTARIWYVFAGYLLLLSLIYFVVNKKGLGTRKVLLISHYIFTLLFVIFFIILSFLSYPWINNWFNEVPIFLLASVYSIILVTDITLFLLSILFMAINLFNLKKL